MCTVSFIPLKNNDFIFTSNRDEALGRKTILPKFYALNGIQTWFPKDAVSGGTWIGISDKNRLVCLLNGGFENHIKKEKYRQSRGKVVLDFLTVNDYQPHIKNYNFENIEPFTLLIVDWDQNLKLTELVWDGENAHFIDTTNLESKIWSSSTLYTNEMKKLRKNWFASFLENEELTQETVLNFHQNYSVGDKNIDLQINRGALKTVSITSVCKTDDNLEMTYLNLLENTTHKNTFSLQKPQIINA